MAGKAQPPQPQPVRSNAYAPMQCIQAGRHAVRGISPVAVACQLFSVGVNVYNARLSSYLVSACVSVRPLEAGSQSGRPPGVLHRRHH